jgi:hypothetical protein
MKTATISFQWLVRVTGLIQIVLGVLIWTGNADSLIPIHMLNGLVLIFSLLVLAVLAAFARVNPALVALAIVWGLITVLLGLTQQRLLPGQMHWLIQVLHLLVGLGAIGQAESLAQRIKARLSQKGGMGPASAVSGATR